MSPSPLPEASPDSVPAFAAGRREGCEAWLKVTPGAAVEAVGGVAADADGRIRLKVKVRAAADRGRANAAVLALLAREWALPKAALAIRHGTADRRKTVLIAGDAAALARRLSRWAAARGIG